MNIIRSGSRVHRMDVADDVTVGDDLDVEDDAEIGDDLHVIGDLDVDGDTWVDDLAVAGDETLAGLISGQVFNRQRSYIVASNLMQGMLFSRGYWGWLNGATPTTEPDLSGRLHTATYHNFVAGDQVPVGWLFAEDFGVGNTTKYLSVADAADLSFGNALKDGMFTYMGWVYVRHSGVIKMLLSKWNAQATAREWSFQIDASGKFRFTVYDESAGVLCRRSSNDALTEGWHFLAVVYEGHVGAGGATCLDAAYCQMFVDGLELTDGVGAGQSTANNDAAYVAMEDLGGDVLIGAAIGAGGAPEYFFNAPMGFQYIAAEAYTTATIWKRYILGLGHLNL